MRPVLVLRPQPGAEATAARARARGLEPLVAPLFEIVPRAWALPHEPFDALIVTSANAARLIDARISRRARAYAVGAATAAALRRAGFHDLIVGDAGVEQLIGMAEAAGCRSLLHLGGEARTPYDPGTMRVEARAVYASEPRDPGPVLADGLKREGVALLHSARAARRFRALADGGRIAAISPAVLEAAGEGWRAVALANRPTDDALLAAAAALCH